MTNVNYYKLIGFDTNSEDINNIGLIISLCDKKLSSYKYLPFLNSTQQTEQKDLQKAKYIFTNEDLKNKYDNIIFKKYIKQNTITEIKSNNFEAYQDSNLDNLFSLNSSSFNNINNNNNFDNSNSKKKEKINTNLVGDRIFSMVGIMNNPPPNTEIDRSFFNES